jgi:serine/threonine protein kinase
MTTFEQRLRDTLSHAYDIERELGGGGMSRVFVATDRSLGRKVVIKLLSPELTADVNRGRFRREIQVAAQLQHPHIVPLLSAGEHEELLYFTMPFIKGESLKSAVEKNGPLPVVDVVRVLYHVCEALDYAHGAGVVHRDIKPANILSSGAYYLITDFGVAKALNAAMPSSAMTSTGMAIGTPAYMSPEQLAGDPGADHRIDIYAVGLLAYELLKGRSPFAATTPQRVLAAVLTHEPPQLIEVRPDVPPSLSEIVMSCLSKEPGERPESARAVLDALDVFSTASGEIRTMEHRVPRMKTPVPTPAHSTPAHSTPALVETVSIGAETRPDEVQAVESDQPSGEVQDVGYDPPKKSRNKMVVGGLALLVPLAAGAIFLSLRAGSGSSDITAPPLNASAVAESTSVALPPAAVPESGAVVANVDSQKVADSVKRVARAEAAKKAAAKNDSLRKVQQTPIAKARNAVAAMLADEGARSSFARGATHMGGVLNKQRRGDLQTQINALVPYLTQAGLGYEHFKLIVQESGITLFDEFGRMKPDALQQFAGAGR